MAKNHKTYKTDRTFHPDPVGHMETWLAFIAVILQNE